MSLSSTHLSEDSETVSYTEPGNVQIRFLMVYKFAFVLFLITECLSHSVLESVVVPLRLPIYAVILIMLSLKISTQRYSYRAGALSLMIIILGTVSGVFANSLSIMMTCFFIVASQGVSYRWYLRTTLIVVAVSAIVFPALSILEIVPDKVIFRGESGTVRRSLGFAHPNTFAAAIMTICLCWVVLRFGKTTLADVIGQGILVAFIFMISDGRMAALVSILGIVYSIYYRFRHGYPMWLARFAWILVIVLPLLSLYFMTNFSSQNAMHMQIDSIFSGRFSILHALYQTYGYSMLGQPVELWGWGSVPQTADGGIQLLDNVFIAFSIRYGFVLFIFVLLGYLLLLRFANRNGIGYMPMLIIVFFIYGFTETNFVLLATNISLVLLNLVVFEDAPCSLTDLVTNEIGFSEQCI